MIVSYDAGYGYIKSLTPKGDHLIFPSVVGEIPAHSSLDLFSNGTQQIEVSGHGWLVGDSALRQSMLTSDMQNATWVLSPEWRAMLLYAISEMTEASRVDIELVTGLPFGDYKALKEPLKESLLGVHKFKREKRNTQHCLEETGETALKTLVGSCGWTMPKTPQLDKEAWARATLEDSNLATVQRNYRAAEQILKRWQEPYMILPARRFYIR